MAKKERILTELQVKFLDFLFSPESQGDYRTAMRLAGYADTVSVREVSKSLREEILEASKNYILMNAPKASFKMSNLLDDPNQAGAANTIKVAQQILDRAGAKAPEEGNTLSVPSGGLFIMPAKQVSVVRNSDELEEEI